MMPPWLVDLPPAPRATPAGGPGAGFSVAEATGEAARCLHCDCRAVEDCRLRHYAQRYGAEPGHYRTERRRFEQQLQPGGVVFEPGKCILCGICVKLTEQAREPLGLTFVGRGFEVRVGAPFHRPLEEGLQRVAAECVAACPTGALAWKSAPATSSPGSPCRS
jgi:NADH dehydrogenase/NADH:ubiquinone oxidoreductase subunit G